MPKQGQASSNEYDIVVVGSGLGGLTAGALLAKEGKKVLVAEQEDRPGGYARSIHFGKYTFDKAVHLIMGCAQNSPLGIGVVDAVLKHLGVRDRCEFLRVDPFYSAQFPDFRIEVPGGREAYLETHIRQFPKEAHGLTQLLKLCSQVYREFVEFPISPRLRDWILVPKRFPKLLRYVKSPLSKVLDSYLSDFRLKAACSALWVYLGLPPSQVSFLVWAAMMASYIEEGAFCCRGGFQHLADAFAEALLSHGGDLVIGSRVKHIRVEKRQVQEVVLENGQKIITRIVISNIDPRITFGELIEPTQVPARFQRKMTRMKISPLAVKLYLGTDLDVYAHSTCHETVVYKSWNPDSVYADAMTKRITGMTVTIPSITDKSLAPSGEHLVVLTALMPPDAGIKLTDHIDPQVAEMLFECGEQVLPDLRNHITFIEGGSDINQKQFPVHYLGPIYGWAVFPLQIGPFRLPHLTPISGLYLAGHWTQPCHGIWTVVLSGVRTARLILNKTISEGMIPLHL